MSTIKTLTKKEYASYLHSSIALIFLGTFLLLTLFTFFWVDKFFERNLADLRPLFHWMPVLLIFLVSSLTMRSWAEEVSQGTLELLMTWPVKVSHLVLGKFLGVMRLVGVALLLTLPLVITVTLLGDLDLGPVVGGYLGAILVAAAYTSIGLWVSSMTANQIVALIGTALLCGFFYLLGAEHVVTLFPYRFGEILRALGTGSRFESIARGVLDVRDLLYYASISLFFGLLNIYGLVSGRWSQGSQKAAKNVAPHASHRKWQLALMLAFVNLFVLNLWLAPLPAFRLDLTARKEFSISPATERLLADLQEPLLIKFYSTQTHPLLDPLRPQVRDLIKEYGIVSKGKVKGVFVDPSQSEEEEKEANQIYNIKPVPFQVPGRNEVKIVNSYFNILVKYGDQHTVLNFEDLIEINVSDFNDIEVKLRNLEYDLTRSIKKAVYGFQGIEELFASLPDPISAKVLVTSRTLPKEIADVPEKMKQVYQDLTNRSGGKFSFSIVDLDGPSPAMTREQIEKDYKIKPFAVSVFTRDTFYLHTLLQAPHEQPEILYPTGDFTDASIRSGIEGVLKRRAKGFIKTVGLWTPPSMEDGIPPQFRQRRGGEDTFRLLQDVLQADYKVKPLDLKSGAVDREVDIVVLVKPQNFEEVERFAVDQFLMQGGTVLVATGSFSMTPGGDGGLSVQPLSGGLEELLASYGVQVEKNLVMDEQNESFPVPIMRNVGGFQIQDLQMVRYPFFVDVRRDGMVKDHPALSGLQALTLQWASALQLNEEQVKAGKIQPLLHSSDHSWVQTSSEIQPDFNLYPEFGFQKASSYKPSVLTAAVKGPMKSFYQEKISPLAQKQMLEGQKKIPVEENKEYDRVIKESTDASRLVVIGSGDFVSDRVLNISRSTGQDRYVNNLHFMQNLVDWSLEDTDLLSIRSRGSYARTLRPLSSLWKNIFEAANYTLVLVLLLSLAGWTKMKRLRVKSILARDGQNHQVLDAGEKAA